MTENADPPTPPSKSGAAGASAAGLVVLSVAMAGYFILVVAMMMRTERVLGLRPFSLLWYACLYCFTLLALWLIASCMSASFVWRWVAICAGGIMVFLYNSGFVDYIGRFYDARCGNSLIDPLMLAFLLLIAFGAVLVVKNEKASRRGSSGSN